MLTAVNAVGESAPARTSAVFAARRSQQGAPVGQASGLARANEPRADFLWRVRRARPLGVGTWGNYPKLEPALHTATRT